MHRTTPKQASSPAKQSPYFILITAGTAAIAGLLFGFDTGVISGAILFINREFGLTPFTEELLVSAALFGAVCSSILSGRLTDLIGRKRAILGTAFIFTLGSILCAVATCAGLLIMGRITLGIAGLFFCFRFVPETKGVPLEICVLDVRYADLGRAL